MRQHLVINSNMITIMNIINIHVIVNQGFYVRLPTRACWRDIGGRSDLIDLTHWTTYPIAAEKWTVKVPFLCQPNTVSNPVPMVYRTLYRPIVSKWVLTGKRPNRLRHGGLIHVLKFVWHWLSLTLNSSTSLSGDTINCSTVCNLMSE